MNKPAILQPEANSRVAKQCEYLAEQYGAQVLRPLYQSLRGSIGDETLTGLDAPGRDANPVDQAWFLVKLLGADDALRAIEGAVREYAQDPRASLESHLHVVEAWGEPKAKAG
ncbi:MULTISPECIES: hypothetical protein [unclassified Thioalkalivibrio]|uniref:hypothetical protein n=1 Tax=unclassified Thioalkalivibrio TaxID=2621013 RepID=UPI000381B354|nr:MULTISPECIES: hypothetical protein [unclassified Thioalkalivibrio]